MENIESFFQFFVQHSFSVVVAAFLLLRMEKELRLLREAISTLKHCPTCKLSPWQISVDVEASEVDE